MQQRIAVSFTLAAFAAVSVAANAQSPGPSQVKAANLATKKAKAITYKLLDRSSGVTVGNVTLQEIGRTRTRVRVQLANPAGTAPRVTIRTGRNCMEPRIASAPRGPMLLNPFTGQTSETVVSLPLTNLSSGNYLLDVQEATQRAQALDACASLK